MTHPEDLLSGYVDGTLEDEERAVVDAHLQGCVSCREEVELAHTAVAALAVLEEEPVPFGVTGPVLAEAGRRFERRRAAVWHRVQWAAGAAAAAALVLVVAVNLDQGGGENDAPSRAAAGATAGAGEAPAESAAIEARAAVVVEVQSDVDYDDAGVRSLAEDAAELRFSAEDPVAEDATAGGESAAQLSGPRVALGCLRASGAPVDQPADELVRLIEARYLGIPAYLAVYLESPGAGQPPSAVVVWVAAKDDCRILGTASLGI